MNALLAAIDNLSSDQLAGCGPTSEHCAVLPGGAPITAAQIAYYRPGEERQPNSSDTAQPITKKAREQRPQIPTSVAALRVPPHSVEAEQAVLGGLMLDNATWEQVADRLREEDFYRQDHRLLFRAISELTDSNSPFDAVTLSEWLQSRSQLEQAGGLAYLATLARDTPTAANVRAYADIVRERSVLRQLIRVGGELAEAAYRPDGSTAAELAQRISERVAAIQRPITNSEAETRCLADVRAERLAWLWPGRFPQGKVSMVVGDPGLGKSLALLAIIAAVTRGSRWPIHSEGAAPCGDVLLLSAEDDPADTIRPRLEAAGAELRRVHVIDAVREMNSAGKSVVRCWNLSDTAALDALLTKLSACKLVVVDPISAYLHGTDSHKNSDIRELLAPLAALATKHRVSIICVSHLNKSAQGSAMYRTTGSLAFVAAARAVYAVTRDRDNPARRLVVPIKANLAPDATGLAYTISTADTALGAQPVVCWENQAVSITAEEALAPPVADDRDVDTGGLNEALEWLQETLETGAMDGKALKCLARDAGISHMTLHRAKDRLRVTTLSQGFGKSRRWKLPSVSETPSSNTGTHVNFGTDGANKGLQSTVRGDKAHVYQPPETGIAGESAPSELDHELEAAISAEVEF
jgi:hypothetical protein